MERGALDVCRLIELGGHLVGRGCGSSVFHGGIGTRAGPACEPNPPLALVLERYLELRVQINIGAGVTWSYVTGPKSQPRG